jgi:hypothetical protein
MGMKSKALERVLDFDAEWQIVERLLPAGWEQKAKALGALRRARGVRDARTLLRILLLHLADGCSLKETAVRAEQLGWCSLSAVGIFKRLRASGRWLAWMGGQLHGKTWPRSLGRECVAVDATTVREPGPTGSLWRVHWSVNLANLQCEFFQLTDVHGGEKFARFPVSEGQLVLGDRGYSNPGGIDYVRTHGGHVLVRVNPMSLPLYRRPEGKPVKVLSCVRDLRVGEVRSWQTWVKGGQGRWHGGRLVVVRRSLAATRRELRRQREMASSRGRRLGRRGKALAGYILVWTSLPAAELPRRQALQCYRRRWQLELVFKRAKTIMKLGQLPKRSDASSKAWLNGKLLVAMLVGKLWQQAERFSPWGYGATRTALPMARGEASVPRTGKHTDPTGGSAGNAADLGSLPGSSRQ